MCGAQDAFGAPITKPAKKIENKLLGKKEPPKPVDPEAERIKAEAAAAQAANLQIAQMRRRKRRSTLLAGGRSVVGAPAGSGSGSGGGAGAGSSGYSSSALGYGGQSVTDYYIANS